MELIKVTVCVFTFNSERFVLDTLESIAKQSYSNIELIVSDDASTDRTNELCERWLSAHGARFNGVRHLRVDCNSGVSANTNRAVSAATGLWIKSIAGDDVLLPDCILDNMTFVNAHPEVGILFSSVRVYAESFDESNYLFTVPSGYPTNLMDPRFDARDQFRILLVSDRINYTPSYFFRKEIIATVGGYDESNKFAEDYPMWLKLTQAGFRLWYFHKETVGYRRHSAALSNVTDGYIFKPLETKTFTFRRQHVHPHLPAVYVFSERWVHTVRLGFEFANWNKNTPFLRLVYKLLTIYLNPFVYLSWFDRRIFHAPDYLS